MNSELKGCMQFVDESPTAYHAIANIQGQLDANQAVQLSEDKKWELQPGKTYYVIRNASAMIAFRLPQTFTGGFMVSATHADSPCFKVKHAPEMASGEHYVKLNTEPYGGLIAYGWFDRALTVAGRLIVRDGDKLTSKLVYVDQDLLVIPSLAIHKNRQVNDGIKIDMQKDMLPLLGCNKDEKLMEVVARSAGISADAIVDADLCVVSREKGRCVGAAGEMLLSPRLDDLMCTYGCLSGFMKAEPTSNVNVLAVFDNEEVGSGTIQGADSDFLKATLLRISEVLGEGCEAFQMHLAKSFLVSADNAHALHPNYPEKDDPVNAPVMNGGIVLKHAANQKYCTDALSGARFAQVCDKAGVPVQHYYNRSGMPGGSTLGNISNTQLAMHGVDIGLAQLAMHSVSEVAGAQDVGHLVKAMEQFYCTGV